MMEQTLDSLQKSRQTRTMPHLLGMLNLQLPILLLVEHRRLSLTIMAAFLKATKWIWFTSPQFQALKLSIEMSSHSSSTFLRLLTAILHQMNALQLKLMLNHVTFNNLISVPVLVTLLKSALMRNKPLSTQIPATQSFISCFTKKAVLICYTTELTSHSFSLSKKLINTYGLCGTVKLKQLYQVLICH